MHAERLPAMEHTCTMFGVDSSNHFPFEARTDAGTDEVTVYPRIGYGRCHAKYVALPSNSQYEICATYGNY